MCYDVSGMKGHLNGCPFSCGSKLVAAIGSQGMGWIATMKEFAKGFYKTALWQKTREQYMKQKGGLCERCLQNGIIRAGEIVHHKTYITPQNILDPNIALSFANLELLCRQCHADEHGHNERKRYTIGVDGSVNT